MNRRIRLLCFLRSCALVAASIFFVCISFVSEGFAQASTLKVAVTNYPLQYFTERLGGKAVEVTLYAAEGEDPAFWNPDAQAIAAMQQSDLIFVNGASYEKWLNKVSLPQSKLVNTSLLFQDNYIRMKEVLSHSHGAEGKHAHKGVAFTTWLDFELAAMQAKAIAGALINKLPAKKLQISENFSQLKKELFVFDERLRKAVSKNPQQKFVFSHPVYQYFIRRYGIVGETVHWEPEQVPSSKQLEELKELLKKHPAKYMIWEGAPADESVEKLKDIGLNSLVFAPIGNTPAEGDFLSVMGENISRFEKCY